MIESIPLVGLSAPALLSIAVLLLLTGRLVPRSTYRDKAEEAERWRQAYEAERDARAISDSQTRALLEASKTNRDIVGALFDSVQDKKSESGGADEASKT